MKDPSYYDDGFYEELGPGDQRKFEKIYRKRGRSIDEERAKESYKRSFEDGPEAKYHLFRDIVNAFSTGKAGFEATLVNPLYEFGQSKSEVLLAKFQSNSVHLCFVSCEIRGHEYLDWSNRINDINELAGDNGAIQSLKKHINCSGLSIGTIQYVTFARDIDITDADITVLRSGTDPEYYAIWQLLRTAEYDEEEEEMEEAKTIKYLDGKMAVPHFQDICQKGIDPIAADNDDIKYSLHSHPVFPLGEVCLDIYLSKYGVADEPKEFFKSEFKSAYFDNIFFGYNRSSMETIADNKIDGLLEFGVENGILKKDDDIVNEREYKIMWGSEDPGDIKQMVKDKYIKSKVPEEKGDIAYTLTKEAFEKEEHTLDDFNDDEI